jgi:hypothetical protein
LLQAIEAGGFSKTIHDKILENEKVAKELNVNLQGLLRKQEASSISA